MFSWLKYLPAFLIEPPKKSKLISDNNIGDANYQHAAITYISIFLNRSNRTPLFLMERFP